MPRPHAPGKFTILDLAFLLTELFDLPLYGGYPSEGARIVRAVLTAITEGLKRGDRVHLNGFGTFYSKAPYKVRKIPNMVIASGPQLANKVKSPVIIEVPGRKHVYFKPSNQFTAMLNYEGHLNREERRRVAAWSKDE
jgi:nucleoid DNA-binding protein